VAERCALVGADLRIESVSGRGTAVIVDCPL
jgi:nitrate/nitrite-specific signal transduction histidine kinase